MSICPRRYASKSVRNLSQLCSSPASQAPPEIRQPLLFLYPEWFRHASSRRYRTEREPGQGHSNPLRVNGDFHGVRDAACKAKSAARRHLSSKPVSRLANDLMKPNIELSPAKEPQKKRKRKPPLDKNEQTVLSKKSFIKFYKQRGPDIRKVIKDDHRIQIAHYLQNVDAWKHFADLKLLLLSTKESGLDVSRLRIRREIIQKLAGTAGPNSWIHYDGTGCIIKVRPAGDETCCLVDLVGTERAREITKQYLEEQNHQPITQADADWITSASSFDQYGDIRDLPHPPQWSVKNFLHYVTAITSSHSRRSAMRYIHQGTEHRNQVVGTLLELVFNESSSSPFASTEALRRALRFCRQHTELAWTAERIWRAAVQLGLQPDIACFNEELSRCLVVKDFSRYNNLLFKLQQQALQPNSRTFALILRYAKDPILRQRILDLIHHHDLAQADGDKASLSSALLKHDVDTYLSRTDGIRELAKHMPTIFGPEWLTTRNIERLLRACRLGKARTIAASDVLDIVQKARDSNVRLDRACMMELLRIAKKAGNLLDALEIMRSRPMQQIQELSQESLEALFLLAWQRQCANICRVLWFQGAALGRITFRMQELVQHSLQNNVSSDEDAHRRAWLLLAGKLIIRSSLDLELARTMFPCLAEGNADASSIAWLLEWTNNNDARHEQMQLSQLLMEHELNTWRFYEPIAHSQFLRLLDEAQALDGRWTACNFASTACPQHLLTQVLVLPVQKRAEALSPGSCVEHAIGQRQWFVVNQHKLDYNTLQVEGKAEDIPITEASQESGTWFEPVSSSLSTSDVRLDELAISAEDEQIRDLPIGAGKADDKNAMLDMENHKGQRLERLRLHVDDSKESSRTADYVFG